MTAYIGRELAPMRFTSILAAAFAALALLLAATGIYGTINYRLSQRLPDLGVRIALGASPRRISWLVLRNILSCVVAGVLIGSVGLFIASHWIGTFLYGVAYYDPSSYTSALLLIIASALAACWSPVWRAATMNPVALLRAE